MLRRSCRRVVHTAPPADVRETRCCYYGNRPPVSATGVRRGTRNGGGFPPIPRKSAQMGTDVVEIPRGWISFAWILREDAQEVMELTPTGGWL